MESSLGAHGGSIAHDGSLRDVGSQVLTRGEPRPVHIFWGSSFNDGTTQTALDPPGGGRFAPIKSSNYGGRPLTGPRPDGLSVLR